MIHNSDNLTEKCTFELLSAYIDGEVTSSERQQVEEWLENDPQIQGLYRRLQYLHQGFQAIPTPQPQYSAEYLSNQVFAKIDQQRKWRKQLIWGGGAIAAVLVTAIGSIFSGENSPSLQFANQETNEELVIALNRPPVDIAINQTNPENEPLMIPLGRSLLQMSLDNK
jgi:anti-sigma factor RsiW